MEPKVELIGHLCDPQAKCSLRGKRLRLVVRSDGAKILSVVYEIKTVLRKHSGERELYKVPVYHVKKNRIEKLDEARVSEAIDQKLESYFTSYQNCSAWADSEEVQFEFKANKPPEGCGSFFQAILLVVLLCVIMEAQCSFNPRYCEVMYPYVRLIKRT